jgi:small ligand-binding sensory domain FIST
MTTASATLFRCAHAAHANWRLATELCLAQLDTQTRDPARSKRANLGFVYLTDGFAEHASEIYAFLKVRTGVTDWVGTVGVGVAAEGVEYFDTPALAVMLADLPEGSARVFSGAQHALGPHHWPVNGGRPVVAALIHADPFTPDLPDLIEDLAGKLQTPQIFGGLTSSRGVSVQIANRTIGAQSEERGVYGSGLSGVAFGSSVVMHTRLTQGCYPVSQARTAPLHCITEGAGRVIKKLDGRPALDVLFEELGVGAAAGRAPGALEALPERVSDGGLFVGFAAPQATQSLRRVPNDEPRMRHVIGLDPVERVIAVAAEAEVGQNIMFCTRDEPAARTDLVRICAELRELMGEAPIRGALYISCLGRGASLFGTQGAELGLIAQSLGPVPLVGFFASGEIANSQLFGYTGVLTVFG